jgi:hypothetical protein
MCRFELVLGSNDLVQVGLQLAHRLVVLGLVGPELAQSLFTLGNLLLCVLDLLTKRNQRRIHVGDGLLQCLDFARLAHNLLVLLGLRRLFVTQTLGRAGLVGLLVLEFRRGFPHRCRACLEILADVEQLEQDVFELLLVLQSKVDSATTQHVVHPTQLMTCKPITCR